MPTNRGRTRRPASPHRVPRVTRLNELIREVVAEELERIGDERLDLVTITNVDVDNDLNRAIITFDSLGGPEKDAPILAALGELRVKLQAALARQITARKTPIFVFRPDEVIRAAERIDEIIRRQQD